MAGKGSGGLAAVRRLTHHPLVAFVFVSGAIPLSQTLALNVGGVVVFLGLAVLWYERYIRRLKATDPAAAEAELAPSAEAMAGAEVDVAA